MNAASVRLLAAAGSAGLSLVLAGSGFAGTSPGTVWGSASGGNGHSYEVVNSITTETQAQANATAAGGYLVTITSAAEQQFVDSLLSSTGAKTGSYWIGLQNTNLTANPAAGDYHWVTGEPFSYSNWGAGQPDNKSGNEDAVAILYDNSSTGPKGVWDDLPSAGVPSPAAPNPGQPYLLTAGYVVEFNQSSGSGTGGTGGTAVPVPAAALLFFPGAAVAGLAAKRLRR